LAIAIEDEDDDEYEAKEGNLTSYSSSCSSSIIVFLG
jgi:hypothetical protein